MIDIDDDRNVVVNDAAVDFDEDDVIEIDDDDDGFVEEYLGFEVKEVCHIPPIFLSLFRRQQSDVNPRSYDYESSVVPGNTKVGSITVPLTSCLIGLESAV